MPKVIKKKTVKKTTAQEDGVKSVALQTVEALREKQKQVLIAVSAIVIIIVLIVSVSMYSSSQYKEAYAIEKEASRYYYGEGIDESQEERWKKALELYQQSVEIKSTPSALFYLGNTYSNLGDHENAIKQYEHFADKFSGETGILPLVYQKLASSYFKTGQNDKALGALGKLGKVDGGIFRDTALVLEARYYTGAGETAKALQKYRELITEFPASPWSPEANAKISADEAEKAATEKEEVGVAESTEGSEEPAAKD